MYTSKETLSFGLPLFSGDLIVVLNDMRDITGFIYLVIITDYLLT
jgi:hypothetical protein